MNSAATTDVVGVLKLTFTACLGFGTATATLVSQSLGARRPDRAGAFAWASVRLGLVVFGVVGVLEGFVFTDAILSFVTHSEAVKQAALLPLAAMPLHLDARAPQNLVPIAALEKELRRWLGDEGLVRRALRTAVNGAATGVAS